MRRPRKTELDAFVSQYARMGAADRAFVRAAITGVDTALALHERRAMVIDGRAQAAFEDLGARVAMGEE